MCRSYSAVMRISLALALLAAMALAPAANADELVVDDSAASVQVSGTWATATTSPGFLGDEYRYRVAGDGSSNIRWPFPSGAPAGTYEVSARWTSGPNRASNAAYAISSSTGSVTVRVDQRKNGGAWLSLGTFALSAAAAQGVKLTDQADGVVVADGVRWVPSGAQPGATPASAGGGDLRLFNQTQFRIAYDPFWDFFQKRGGVRTFGYPVSRDFFFLGCTTQLFQRAALQQCGREGVGELNLLESGLMPFTHFNGSSVPPPDPDLIAAAPLPGDTAYAPKAIDFVRQHSPDTFDGKPVRFFTTFESMVGLSDAFPQGGDAGLLPLLNLQLWGLPTSKPAYDPRNHEFIYQRFQRGVMHFDTGCQCTQGLLLSDYLKDLLTGQNLPADLMAEAEASGSALLRAVPNGKPPHDTVFGDAFTTQAPVVAPPPPAAAGQPLPPTGPTTVSSPDYGMSLFLWGHSNTTDRDLKLVTDAGFRWQKTLFQWRQIEGACKGCFDWTEADRVVQASARSGVKIIARLDFQPTWARHDGASNGPPDNYQDYADFVSAFVKRYAGGSTIGQVQAVEVWNEVNLDREWGGQKIDRQQAAEYVKLLGVAYTAAKAADPNVIVVTAGLSPTGVTDGHSADDVQYLQWLYDAGLQGKYDVLGAHGNTQAPEVDAAFNSMPKFPHPSFYFRRIEQLREVMVKNGDSAKQVWLLEFGWTSDVVHANYSWFAVSEDKKGSNIVKAFEYAQQHWRPWIGVMTLWTLPDPTWTADREEYWWAITNADGSVRPAYTDVLQARRSGVLS